MRWPPLILPRFNQTPGVSSAAGSHLAPLSPPTIFTVNLGNLPSFPFEKLSLTIKTLSHFVTDFDQNVSEFSGLNGWLSAGFMDGRSYGGRS